MASRIKQ